MFLTQFGAISTSKSFDDHKPNLPLALQVHARNFIVFLKIYLCLLTTNCTWNHVITYIYNTTKVVFNFLFGKKGIFKLILRSELEVTAAFLQVEFKSRYYLVYTYIIIIVTHCCCDVIICFLCKIKFNEKIF